ncbi:TerD family protein [Streptomyces rimosus]
MTTTLTKGGNAPLPAGVCLVSVASSAGIDVSAVLLGADGKVRSDEDLVFYNHLSQDNVALRGQTIVASLAAVPFTVERIAVVVSIDPEFNVPHFDASNTPQAVIHCEGVWISFVPPAMKNSETVAIMVELYRRGDGWRVRAVGQGWDTGLAGLAADVGVVVDDPGSSPATPPPVAVAPRPRDYLGKIELTKAGRATIDMRKEESELVVTAALEWNGGSIARRQAGADLDLYALYVPGGLVTPRGKRPNKTDHVIYYRQRGSLSAVPYIALDSDSRAPERETVTIRRPDLQGYVLLCAYSAVENGTGSFTSYGAHAVITDGRGSTVTVPLFNNRNQSYWVAIALLDFTVPGGVQIRHVEKYSGNHVEARPTLYSNGNFRMSTGKVEFKTR